METEAVVREQSTAQLYCERARFELGELERRGAMVSGSAFAPLLLVKGDLNSAERAGAELLSGGDGTALRASFARLGYPEAAWAACSCTRRDGTPLEPSLLALAVETFDPEAVLALDRPAAVALARAWGLEAPPAEGDVAYVRGRRVLALGGFEHALADPRAKQVMWARLKRLPPLAAPL